MKHGMSCIGTLVDTKKKQIFSLIFNIKKVFCDIRNLICNIKKIFFNIRKNLMLIFVHFGLP